MNTNETPNTPKGSDDGGFIAFSNDNPSSNWRKTPFKSHQNRHAQFSPFQGSPQGFSSPIHQQRNFSGNRRQSGNSYGDRFRGNQSHNRGNNNWRNRNDNRKPNHNRSYNKNGGEPVNIADYFHPSMIQDPWRHLMQNSSKTHTTIDKNCEESGPDTKEQDDAEAVGGSPST